ncbi:MAG: signal peptidase I [Candidatus Moranbacteria bacterium]|nr:signal peptidase I [Candidatus Moranbacteria bacterium]
MKIFKFVQYLFFGAIGIVIILLVVSAFPIPGNYKVMVVQSGSMEPAIKTGSIVATRPGDYQVGDVISFADAKSAKLVITHRIVEIKSTGGRTSFITKGDANNGQDSSEIPQENVLGKVFFTVPYLGYVVHTAKQPYGFVALVVIPALWIIFDEAKKIKDEIIKMKREKEKSV